MLNVLITGCASGMGRGLVAAFSRAGHRVLATGLSLDSLITARDEDSWPSTVEIRKLDVRSPSDWDLAVSEVTSRWGSLDVLCNVAGYLLPGRVDAFETSAVDAHIDVNTKGVIFGSRAAARVMVGQKKGHIINVASLAGLAPVPGLSLYCASKFAVRGFSLSIASELRPHGVAVTVVCPDAVQTPMLDLQVDYEESALVFSGPAPLTVDDICKAVLGPVLKDRPLEVTLPLSRGVLARLGGLAPGMAFSMEPMLRRKGRALQAKTQARRARG